MNSTFHHLLGVCCKRYIRSLSVLGPQNKRKICISLHHSDAVNDVFTPQVCSARVHPKSTTNTHKTLTKCSAVWPSGPKSISLGLRTASVAVEGLSRKSRNEI